MTRHIVNPQNIPGYFNQVVKTPLGSGRAFGVFELKDARQEGIGRRVVVRLNVDDQTRPYMKHEHCLTPTATQTAIFTFDPADVEV